MIHSSFGTMVKRAWKLCHTNSIHLTVENTIENIENDNYGLTMGWQLSFLDMLVMRKGIPGGWARESPGNQCTWIKVLYDDCYLYKQSSHHPGKKNGWSWGLWLARPYVYVSHVFSKKSWDTWIWLFIWMSEKRGAIIPSACWCLWCQSKKNGRAFVPFIKGVTEGE